MNGLELEKKRKQLGITQEELSKLIGVSRKTINSYENGANIPVAKVTLFQMIFDEIEKKGYNLQKERVRNDADISNNDEEIENYTNKNGVKFYIYPDDTYKIEVLKIPFPAYATYLEVFNDEDKLKQEFTTTTFKVDKVAKGNYLAFDVKNDSMWNEGGYDTPDGAEILAREIGRHLWNGRFKNEKYGYILMTKQNIFHKDIKDYNEQTGEITLSSRNPECEDFKISINDVFRLFNVIKRTF